MTISDNITPMRVMLERCQYQMLVNASLDTDDAEINQWLVENIKGEYYRTTIMHQDVVMFNMAHDALLFKLRFP